MPVIADVRPPAVNVPFRPGDAVTLTASWPTGELTGRTFTSTLDDADLTVTIAGDDLIVEASAAQTAAISDPASWELLEDLGATTATIMVGTWSPSQAANASTDVDVTVVVGSASVDVTVLPGGVLASSLAAEVAALEAADTAEAAARAAADTSLAARVAALEDRSASIRWTAASVWDRFTAEAVSTPDNTLTLSVDGEGRGTIAGSGSGVSGNDRRVYVLDDTTYTDVEVRILTAMTGGLCQLGLPMRISDGTFDRVAVTPWYNIFLSGTGQFLPGVWEWNGTTLHTNQQSGSHTFGGELISATGDGATITVHTRHPHGLTVGTTNVSLTDSVSGGDGTIDTVPDALTFTMSGTGVGTVVGGRWSRAIMGSGERWLAARLFGTRLLMKQWHPGNPEPSWTGVDTLPVDLPGATLTGGSSVPTSGQVGLMLAHFGANGTMEVSDYDVVAL